MDVWLLARKDAVGIDSKEQLEGLGFTILGVHDDLFYRTRPPTQTWTTRREPLSSLIFIKDPTGKTRISQHIDFGLTEHSAILAFER